MGRETTTGIVNVTDDDDYYGKYTEEGCIMLSFRLHCDKSSKLSIGLIAPRIEKGTS